MNQPAEFMSPEEARALGVVARYSISECSRIGRLPSYRWAIEETDRHHWEKPHIITVPPKEESK